MPYNPQGQEIVERAHRTLKELLQKQKGGIAYGKTPREQLSSALFTLIFLILDTHGRSAVDRHAATKPMTNQIQTAETINKIVERTTVTLEIQEEFNVHLTSGFLLANQRIDLLQEQIEALYHMT